jgi:hypothetical protein
MIYITSSLNGFASLQAFHSVETTRRSRMNNFNIFLSSAAATMALTALVLMAVQSSTVLIPCPRISRNTVLLTSYGTNRRLCRQRITKSCPWASGRSPVMKAAPATPPMRRRPSAPVRHDAHPPQRPPRWIESLLCTRLGAS